MLMQRDAELCQRDGTGLHDDSASEDRFVHGRPGARHRSVQLAFALALALAPVLVEVLVLGASMLLDVEVLGAASLVVDFVSFEAAPSVLTGFDSLFSEEAEGFGALALP